MAGHVVNCSTKFKDPTPIIGYVFSPDGINLSETKSLGRDKSRLALTKRPSSSGPVISTLLAASSL